MLVWNKNKPLQVFILVVIPELQRDFCLPNCQHFALNSMESLIHSKLLELFLRLAIWKQTENDFFFLVLTLLPATHQADGGMLHMAKSVATSCVGLTLSSLIDASVLGGGLLFNTCQKCALICP